MDKIIYWIWLSLACTPATSTFAKLIERFEGAEDIYNADEQDIRRTVGSRNSDCTALLDKSLEKANEIYRFCLTKDVGIVAYNDEQFPVSLREIQNPPVLLYYRGTLPDFKKGFRVAIVGTRMLSDYGKRNAFIMGMDMARAGATVVSGMAIGIDGVALAGALAVYEPTIAVLGSGINVCYPPQHKRLAQEIVKKGCVITEFAPGTKPERYNFPKRNRLISGLCAATVVVEGKEDSGAMITARYAQKQNRKVYAFPGNVNDPNSQAANLLLKNGARLCTCADDLVRDFENEYPGALNPHKISPDVWFNIPAALSEFQVCAVTPTDPVFNTFKKRGAKNAPPPEPIVQVEEEDNSQRLFDLDAETIRIYKKLPADGVCTIESLTDERTPLRTVMRHLLKLEMGRFVDILPRERVKRKK